jgi:cyclophilin family peptidyl-prolyl cis-trans isomerase
MFKEENRIYWYLLGTVIMMALLLLIAKDIVIPYLLGRPTSITPGQYQYNQPPATVIEDGVNYSAEIDTNFGKITVDLYENAAPNNVNSFVFLANQGYYNGTKFHRLIKDLLVQGGDRNTLDNDPNNDGYGNPGYFIADEINWDSLNLSEAQRDRLRAAGYRSTDRINSKPLSRFVLAMANTAPNTNSNHFFFVLADASDSRIQQMQGRYTVIGKVTQGGRVLQTINDIAVDQPDALIPRPQQEIVINKITITSSNN